MSTLLHDLAHAFRSLRRSPGSTAMAVLILALAIGGTATLWQALDATVLRPLPFAASDRLVRLFDVHDGAKWTVSPSNFADYRDASRGFSSVAAFSDSSFALSGGEGGAEQVPGASVTADFFAALRLDARLGRTLGAADDGQAVVLLSDELWRRRYGADPGIVGRAIRVDGADRVVVGVLPAGRSYPLDSRLWVPLAFSPDELQTQRGAHYLGVLARLRDGVDLAAVNSELATLSARLAAAFPNTNEKIVAQAHDLQAWTVRGSRPTLVLLLGAVAVALLAACANLACLSLARTVARGQELALRSSLGADARRLARGLVLENLLLAAMGALAGGALAAAAIGKLPLVLGDLPRLSGLRFDGAGVLALVALAGGAGLLVGLAPAGFALRRQPAEVLRAAGRGVAGSRGAGRVRRLLVVATTALALVLLAGAALVVRSYNTISTIDPGFETSGRLLFSVALPTADYPTPEKVAQFVATLDEQLQALPGVRHAGATFGQPFGDFGYGISLTSIDGRQLPDDDSRRSPQIRFVTADYFRALGVPLRSGRHFTPGDRFGAPNVAIANESGARLVLGGDEPLGHTLEISTTNGLGRGRVRGEVIGVVADIREQQLDDEASPTLYFAIDQFPVDFLSFVVETEPSRLDPLVPAVRGLVARLDPNLPVFRVRTLEQLVADSLATRRTMARLMSGFASLAVALAALGLFGILSQSVTEQRRELAVRSALGATPASLAALVLRQAGGLAALGLVVGFLTLLPLTRFLRSSLYQLSPTDPATLAGAALFLALVALLSGWLPAQRALRVEPMAALRSE